MLIAALLLLLLDELFVTPTHILTAMFGPLGLSFAPQVQKSRTLHRYFKPFADWYAQIAGYRQMGLKYDDLREFCTVATFMRVPALMLHSLVLEERDDVQKVRYHTTLYLIVLKCYS